MQGALLAHFAACWQFCPDCRKHGFVLTALGQKSEEVLSKEAAMQVIADFHNRGLISKEEVIHLKQSLGDSELAPTESSVSLETRVGFAMECLGKVVDLLHSISAEQCETAAQEQFWIN